MLSRNMFCVVCVPNGPCHLELIKWLNNINFYKLHVYICVYVFFFIYDKYCIINVSIYTTI